MSSVLSVRRVACPHCGSQTRIAKTKQLAKTCREITCHCENDQCGCVFVAEITPVRILSPSAIPDPDIFIPLSRHIDLKRLQGELFKPVARA